MSDWAIGIFVFIGGLIAVILFATHLNSLDKKEEQRSMQCFMQCMYATCPEGSKMVYMQKTCYCLSTEIPVFKK